MHLFQAWIGAQQYSIYQMATWHLRQQLINL